MKKNQAKQRKVYWGIGIAAAIIIVLALAFSSMQLQFPSATTTTVTTPSAVTTTVPTKGTLLIAVKDAKQKLQGLGDVTSLILTVDSIQVHKTGDNTTNENVTAEGWITVFSGSKTFDLLDYTDVKAILGEVDLEPGTYTQIRLYIDNATIKINNPDMYVRNKTYSMTLAGSGNLAVPSKVLKLNHPFTIEEGKTLALTLDFDVPHSVIRTGTGYFLKPVIGITEEKLEKGQMPANSTVL